MLHPDWLEVARHSDPRGDRVAAQNTPRRERRSGARPPDAAAWVVESWKDWAKSIALEPLAIERTSTARRVALPALWICMHRAIYPEAFLQNVAYRHAAAPRVCLPLRGSSSGYTSSWMIRPGRSWPFRQSSASTTSWLRRDSGAGSDRWKRTPIGDLRLYGRCFEQDHSA